MQTNQRNSAIYAILAAALYAFSIPISKILLSEIPAALLAGLLYIGAGTGMLLIAFVKKCRGYKNTDKKCSRNDLIYIIAMILLDIAAPILLMMGLKWSTSANVSLLNNFEIVMTSIIAAVLFKETISKKLWRAIILITFASILLSFEDASSLTFSYGSLFVILACICWGFENNCTRMLSLKNPMEVVIIKGLGSGFGSLIIAFILHEKSNHVLYIIMALLLGFAAYGLSIYLYVYAQRELGAAKTSAYYAIAPFIGAGLSLLIFLELPSLIFVIALIIMIIGTYFASHN